MGTAQEQHQALGFVVLEQWPVPFYAPRPLDEVSCSEQSVNLEQWHPASSTHALSSWTDSWSIDFARTATYGVGSANIISIDSYNHSWRSHNPQ